MFHRFRSTVAIINPLMPDTVYHWLEITTYRQDKTVVTDILERIENVYERDYFATITFNSKQIEPIVSRNWLAALIKHARLVRAIDNGWIVPDGCRREDDHLAFITE